MDGVLSFQDVLVSINKIPKTFTISNSPYSGRVSGIWNGSSPGQVTFTLNSIQTADERFYICKLQPDKLEKVPVYNTVYLLVLGK